jgi:hypothetical protein
MEALKLEALGRRIAEEQDRVLKAADTGSIVSDGPEVRYDTVSFDADTFRACVFDRGSIDVLRQQFLAKAAELPSPARRRVVATAQWVGGGLAAAAAVFVLVRAVPRGNDLSFAVGNDGRQGNPGEFVAAPPDRPLLLSFSEGTRFELGEETRARIASVDPSAPEIVLESGRVDVQVADAKAAPWRVSSGPFVVSLASGAKLGSSRFVTKWDPAADRFEVTLLAGQATVTGCLFNSGREVMAGETLRASCSAGWFEASRGESAQTRPESAAVPQPAAPQPAALQPAALAVAVPTGSWQVLAKEGRHAEAYAAASAAGYAAEAAAQTSAADLVLLADLARHTGNEKDATLAYERLRKSFAGSPQASTAAYTLGRIAMENPPVSGELAAHYARAAKLFQSYLNEQPRGALAREAMGGLMEAYYRGGSIPAARRVAKNYVAAFPTGPQAKLARDLAAGRTPRP